MSLVLVFHNSLLVCKENKNPTFSFGCEQQMEDITRLQRQTRPPRITNLTYLQHGELIQRFDLFQNKIVCHGQDSNQIK